MWYPANPPKEGVHDTRVSGTCARPLPTSLRAVQRLYSMFPSGWPGLALLLLRVSVALASYSDVRGAFGLAASGWLSAGLLALSVMLILGLLTPAVALLVAIVELAALAGAPVTGTATAMVFVLNALALALLGPGACSLDARLFGRRVLVLNPGGDPERR